MAVESPFVARESKAESNRQQQQQQLDISKSTVNVAKGAASPATATGGGAAGYTLFSSTEGLLDLDSNSAHSSASPSSQRIELGLGLGFNNQSNSSSSGSRYRANSAEKRFSIQSSSSSEHSLEGKQQQRKNSKPSPNQTPLSWQRWMPFRSSSSSSSEWRSTTNNGGPAKSSVDYCLEMATKRYYFLLLALSLIIVTCLLASLVISRSVGVDPAEVDESSSDAVAGRAESLMNSPPIIEYEQRSIDLVDLIECGKTFAYTKVRLQVRVPKSSPIYRQQSSGIIRDRVGGLLPDASITGAALAATSSSRQQPTSLVRANSLATTKPIKEVKFVLINPDELNPDETAPVAATRHKNANTKNSTNSTDTTSFLLAENLGPILQQPASSVAIGPPSSTESALDRPLSARISSFLDTSAAASDERRREEVLEASKLMVDLQEDLDPLQNLESELNLSISALNRTMIDCFLVDTDKRYSQKVALESRHRDLASTRKVSLAKMMQIIAECRELTWASLPSTLPIKAAADGGVPLIASPIPQTRSAALNRNGTVIALASEPQYNQNHQSHNIIGSLLEDWFRGSRGPTTSSPNHAISNGDQLTPKGSRNSRQVSTLPPPDESNRAQQAADQSSYLTMGLSMMSGIVPNTLWCGLGDRASNYSELGVEYKVDSCCRAHDHCPIRMKPFTADYGLVNWSMSTRSHCDCDFDFDACMRTVNSTLSNVIRNLYFRFVGLQCIDVEGRRINRPQM